MAGHAVGGLDPTFERKVDQLKESAKSVAGGLSNTKQPTYDETEDPGVIDRSKISSIHRAFNRDKLAADYSRVRTDRGSGGRWFEIQLLRDQHDFVATVERDLHVRSRSRIRSLGLAAAARRALGHDNGSIELVRKNCRHTLLTKTPPEERG
jgi:hypothetical protein